MKDKFPSFSFFCVFTQTPWAKYPPEVCVSDMSDGWKVEKSEKKNERIFFKQEGPCSAG